MPENLHWLHERFSWYATDIYTATTTTETKEDSLDSDTNTTSSKTKEGGQYTVNTDLEVWNYLELPTIEKYKNYRF